MKLGMQAGLGPRHIVLDGDPAPTLIFGPCPLWPNSRMELRCHALDMEIGLGPGDFVLVGDPAPPKGGTAQIFGP